jgi:hypothetical protein
MRKNHFLLFSILVCVPDEGDETGEKMRLLWADEAVATRRFQHAPICPSICGRKWLRSATHEPVISSPPLHIGVKAHTEIKLANTVGRNVSFLVEKKDSRGLNKARSDTRHLLTHAEKIRKVEQPCSFICRNFIFKWNGTFYSDRVGNARFAQVFPLYTVFDA